VLQGLPCGLNVPGPRGTVNQNERPETPILSLRKSYAPYLGAALLSLTLGQSEAAAQSIPSPYEYIEQKAEAGPFIGIMNASTGRFGFGPEGGIHTGVRWGYELSGPISFETVVGYVRGERDVVSPGRAEGDRIIGTADVGITTVDARFKFSFPGARTWNGISPFLVFGGGLALDTEGLSPLEETSLDPADQFEFGTGFFGTLGIGSRWFVTERFGLRGDAVFSLWSLGTPPGFSDPDRGFTAVEESEWARGLSFTISGLWRW